MFIVGSSKSTSTKALSIISSKDGTPLPLSVIIDGGSCHNLASEELCSKLQLVKRKHPHPYKVQWLSDSGTIRVEHTVQVSFKIGAYEETLECDVVPMTVCHLLLGRPWQLDRDVFHNGRTNNYSFKMKGKEYVL